MKNTQKENIMEHSEQVAQIAHALGVIANKIYGKKVDINLCSTLALFHETSEVLTGDLPTPIKYFNPQIKSAYKEIESIANKKLLTMLPDEFQAEYETILEPDKNSYEYKLVKLADKLSAYIKCLEEIKVGNKEFIKAEKTIKSELYASDSVELKYFMENFLPGFSKTLDELE